MTQTAMGLFPVSYTVTTGLEGAPALQLNLLVNTPAQKITGTADITNDSIHPPLKMHADVWGTFSYMTVMGPGSRILISGQGNHGGPTSNSMVFVKFHLIVEPNWNTGKGSFSYFYNNEWHNIENATVRLNPVFNLPVGPGPVIPDNSSYGKPYSVMYGPAIQQAIAQNSPLSELKALAQQAQQQLDNLPALQAGLAALHVEIGKLTA